MDFVDKSVVQDVARRIWELRGCPQGQDVDNFKLAEKVCTFGVERAVPANDPIRNPLLREALDHPNSAVGKAETNFRLVQLSPMLTFTR